MPTRARIPIALTIAGSDSSGGAGLQADLQTFAALGVHGTSVVTCLTAQNPRAVLAVQPVEPGFVRQQLKALFAELKPRAVKTGMLYDADLIRLVADFFHAPRRPPLVVDPVMVAGSGASLLRPDAQRVLRAELLPRASLITPNLPEAEVLLGRRIRNEREMREACSQLVRKFGCAALLKGGHLAEGSVATDIFYDGRTELCLRAPFVRGVATHGTGCTYSAAVTAFCARGVSLPEAVRQAKVFITQAIRGSSRVGRHFVLGWRGAQSRLAQGQVSAVAAGRRRSPAARGRARTARRRA